MTTPHKIGDSGQRLVEEIDGAKRDGESVSDEGG